VLADLGAVQKRKERSTKAARGGDKVAIAELALCEKLEPHLNTGKMANTLALSPDERHVLKGFFLMTAKPTLFACNVVEKDLATADQNSFVQKVREYVKAHHDTQAVVISAQIESELVDLSPEEAVEYLKDLGVAESGMGALIRTAYQLLGLRTYLTTGEKETRAWTIHVGNTAPQAAGVIHSDFERGFIAAECTAYEDLVTCGSFAKAREAGKLRIEGKEYVVQDGDVLEFRFNV
jgi:GTP-binding protein YchF